MRLNEKNIDSEIFSLFQKNKNNEQHTKYTDNLIDSLLFKQIKSNYKRSKLLFSILEECTEAHIIKNQKNLITKFCVIVELLNIANKIHDLIDNRKPNKSKLSINKLINISLEQAILLGDLVFTLAFEQMSIINQDIIFKHFANTTQSMALFEAKLLSYDLNQNSKHKSSDQVFNEVMALIENKHWPLFNSILFLIKLINPDVETNNTKYTQIEKKLIAYNKKYACNKVITKQLILKQDLDEFLEQHHDSLYSML